MNRRFRRVKKKKKNSRSKRNKRTHYYDIIFMYTLCNEILDRFLTLPNNPSSSRIRHHECRWCITARIYRWDVYWTNNERTDKIISISQYNMNDMIKPYTIIWFEIEQNRRIISNQSEVSKYSSGSSLCIVWIYVPAVIILWTRVLMKYERNDTGGDTVDTDSVTRAAVWYYPVFVYYYYTNVKMLDSRTSAAVLAYFQIKLIIIMIIII